MYLPNYLVDPRRPRAIFHRERHSRDKRKIQKEACDEKVSRENKRSVSRDVGTESQIEVQ